MIYHNNIIILLLHSDLGHIFLNPKQKKPAKSILKIVQNMFCKQWHAKHHCHLKTHILSPKHVWR